MTETLTPWTEQEAFRYLRDAVSLSGTDPDFLDDDFLPFTVEAPDLLRAAALLLEEKGWVQGVLVSVNGLTGSCGGYCTVGAVTAVGIVAGASDRDFLDRTTATGRAEAALDAVVREESGFRSIAALNDSPETTRETMTALLRKAADRLDEEAARG